MDHWTEIYTALCVAKSGTVSKAADVLGVHRATVNRHIDTLEASLGAKLFLRHRRGYELTDTGKEFLSVASRAHDTLDDFFGRVRVQNAELDGEIVVTTVPQLTQLILPAILEFRRRYPRTRVSVNTSNALARLEKAEAHVALRVGQKPSHNDYVVQHFCALEFTLYVHQAYVDRRGMPEFDDLGRHVFVGNPSSESRAPMDVWLGRYIAPEQVVLKSENATVLQSAIWNGDGLGFMPRGYARQFPELIEIIPPQPEWRVESWLVTHIDVHRTDKIQSMLECLKAVTAQG
ncbi:MAG: LysR family transcriptional regulator [Pseudomonadota bacterium]